MPTAAHALTETDRAFVAGFTENDPARTAAVVLGFFEKLPVREVEALTGLGYTTVSRLVNRFKLAYGPWKEFHRAPPPVEADPEADPEAGPD